MSQTLRKMAKQCHILSLWVSQHQMTSQCVRAVFYTSARTYHMIMELWLVQGTRQISCPVGPPGPPYVIKPSIAIPLHHIIWPLAGLRKEKKASSCNCHTTRSHVSCLCLNFKGNLHLSLDCIAIVLENICPSYFSFYKYLLIIVTVYQFSNIKMRVTAYYLSQGRRMPFKPSLNVWIRCHWHDEHLKSKIRWNNKVTQWMIREIVSCNDMKIYNILLVIGQNTIAALLIAYYWQHSLWLFYRKTR